MRSITNSELAKLAARNLGPAEIALQLDTTTSAVTQALQAPDVQHLIELERSKSQGQQLDNRYDSLEEQVLGILEKRIPLEGQTMKVRELTHTLSTLNGIKRRTGVFGSQSGAAQPVVQLVMPVQVSTKIVLNEQSEIVEIDGRTMVTANPEQINQLRGDYAALPADLL